MLCQLQLSSIVNQSFWTTEASIALWISSPQIFLSYRPLQSTEQSSLVYKAGPHQSSVLQIVACTLPSQCPNLSLLPYALVITSLLCTSPTLPLSCKQVDPRVLVCAWVGKEFPDMRQNDRRIKFLRVGDTIRTEGRLDSRGNQKLLKAFGQFLQAQDRENSYWNGGIR